MRVLENREWKQEVRCRACTSSLEIRFSDLERTNLGEIAWTCCVCGSENGLCGFRPPSGYPEIRSRARDREIRDGARRSGPEWWI